MQTIPRPSGPFQLGQIPLPLRRDAAETVIRCERLADYRALELTLAAVCPSRRLYVLTGEEI